MDNSKQLPQATSNGTTPVKFWGTIVMAALGILADGRLLWNVLRLPKTPMLYGTIAFYVLILLAGFAVVSLTLRGHQKSGAQLALYGTVALFASGPFLYTGRALTVSFQHINVSG